MNQSELIEKLHFIIQVEAKLTDALETAEPWLPSAPVYPNKPRVRPIPQNMDQVNQILSLARSLAARTSAPAGWNDAAPVVGFSTPNPLPHQLRGGALAALQLQRARHSRDTTVPEQAIPDQPAPLVVAEQEAVENTFDPKRREINVLERDLARSKSDLAREMKRPKRSEPEHVSMNLSDSEDSDDSG